MSECLPWVALLERCRGLQTEVLRTSSDHYINLLTRLGINDALMNEMYMVLSYALLERLGEDWRGKGGITCI